MIKKDRMKATPASYLILKKENQILMHLRQNSGYMDGFYSLVAGHVEPLEGPTACIIREAKEEAGINIEKEDIKMAHTLYRPQKDDERVDFFYLCETWKGDVCNAETNKCGQLKFFNVDELPENTIPYVKHVIKEVLKGKTFSEFFND
jgi:8-oxo-dGTP diphosphatase